MISVKSLHGECLSGESAKNSLWREAENGTAAQTVHARVQKFVAMQQKYLQLGNISLEYRLCCSAAIQRKATVFPQFDFSQQLIGDKLC